VSRNSIPLRLYVSTLLSVCLFGWHLAAAPQLTRVDASRFAQKLTIINLPPTRPAKPRRTPVSEQELNAYLAYDAGEQIPAGIVQPSISILGDGRLAGRAFVDLDLVRRQRESRGLLDPLRYLSGRLEIAASGLLRTREGIAHFELESASLSGVTVPKLVLQELLSFYSRTPENPDGLGLDDPFALPANIREIEVGRGQAIVVQ
jgi:hypothetical protein